MSLYVKNLGGAPVTLVRPVAPVVTVPAGMSRNVTSELAGLAPADYIALEAQRVGLGTLTYHWTTGEAEFSVGALAVTMATTGPATATNIAAGGHDHGGAVANESAHTHPSGAIGGATADESAHTHPAGAVAGSSGAGSAHSHSSGAITCDKIRFQQEFTAPPAGGTNYVGQYAAGAAIDDAVGPFTRFVPPRTVRITRGGAGVATIYTIDGTDPDGVALQEIINAPGAGPYEGTRAFATITRVRSDVDPTVTTDVQTGDGLGLGVVASDIDVVGLNGALEAPTSTHAATGTVIPASVPNGVRNYSVQYRVLPTATAAATGAESAHTHGTGTYSVGASGAGSAHSHGPGTLASGATGAGSAHGHAVAAVVDHNHTQNAHSH